MGGVLAEVGMLSSQLVLSSVLLLEWWLRRTKAQCLLPTFGTKNLVVCVFLARDELKLNPTSSS